MKTISPALTTHLQQPVTTLAQCWKLTRADGVVMGFTDCDRNLVVDGRTYVAATGFTPSAVADHADLAVDNMDVEGMLSSDSIIAEDIEAGKYDGAAIEIFLVNHMEPGQGVIRLRKGTLGDISYGDGRFIAEVRGLAQALAQNIGELYSPLCRARLGDARCKVNVATFQQTGAVTAVTDTARFKDAGRTEAVGVYRHGRIEFLTGANLGVVREIKEFAKTEMVLALPLPYPPAIGDGYRVTQGCDKTLRCCVERFGNALNFRGEPHVPGLDRMLETSTTRSVSSE